MPTTTNYGWTTPADTDLVKDGAAAIRSLGTAIDTTTYNNAQAAIAKTIVDAKGDLIAATAADTVARLAVGSNDQVLTADSSTATGLKWATPSSGGMTLLETLSLSGASVVSSTIPGTYKHLQLVIRNYRPANNGKHLFCRVNGDSNARYNNQNLMPQSYNVAFSETEWIFAFGQNNTASTTSTGYVPIYDYANTTTWKVCYPQNVGNGDTTATNVTSNMYKCYYNQTSAITSLTFLAETGNMTSGSVLIYGVS
jgi:hypothetical protein